MEQQNRATLKYGVPQLKVVTGNSSLSETRNLLILDILNCQNVLNVEFTHQYFSISQIVSFLCPVFPCLCLIGSILFERMNIEREGLYEKKLALRIIEEHFGNIPRFIAHQLLLHPSSSLKTILGYSIRTTPSTNSFSSLSTTSTALIASPGNITREMVKKALVVLLQHNCLHVITVEETDEAPVFLYKLHISNVLLRIRFPKIIRLAERRYGAVGEVVMAEVLLHGRLQLSQIKADSVDRLLRKPSIHENGVKLEADAESKEEVCEKDRKEELAKQVHEVFLKLVESRLLIRVKKNEKKQSGSEKEVKKRGTIDLAPPPKVGTKRKAAPIEKGTKATSKSKLLLVPPSFGALIESKEGFLLQDDESMEQSLWCAGNWHINLNLL